MKLHIFDRHALKEWKDTGYTYVNLTPSANIDLTVHPEKSFILLEPFLDESKAKKYETVVSITSSKLEEIIQARSGKYYK